MYRENCRIIGRDPDSSSSPFLSNVIITLLVNALALIWNRVGWCFLYYVLDIFGEMESLRLAGLEIRCSKGCRSGQNGTWRGVFEHFLYQSVTNVKRQKSFEYLHKIQRKRRFHRNRLKLVPALRSLVTDLYPLM